MFVLDEPYISDLLIDTINKNNYPILYNKMLDGKINKFEDDSNFELLNKQEFPKIYTNSENSLNKIFSLKDTKTAQLAKIFKNKALCREKIKSLYPDFYFREVSYDELFSIDRKSLKYPFILKPSVGFLSFGVYKITNEKEFWHAILDIKENFQKAKGNLPDEVLNSNSFLFEEIIEGEEFAVDFYFNSKMTPCILNIFYHPFLNSSDLSDRMYITNKNVIEENYSDFISIFEKIGEIFKIKNFPIHIELRKNKNKVVPIEINPLRFAGWCTTDLAYFAYGINVYEYFYEDKIPNWNKILKDNSKTYAFIMMEVPLDIDKNKIKSFNYNGLLCDINAKILDVRKFDFKNKPMFCVLFVEAENLQSIENVLKLDVKKYINLG